jgi:hypothetical protein
MGVNEFLEDSSVTENVYRYIDSLPDEYKDKEELQAVIDNLPVAKQGMTIS